MDALKHVTGLAELIRILILRGEMASGELLNEVLLVERFRTGRSTVREALRLLEGRGLLVANHSGGMRVIALDSDELAEAIEVSAALEALSAAEAARRSRHSRLATRTLRRLPGLIDAVEVATAHDRVEEALFADRTFHLAVSALAGNRPCHATLDHLWDRILVARLQSRPSHPRPASASRDHHELIASIAGGDGDEASETARRHALAEHATAAEPAGAASWSVPAT